MNQVGVLLTAAAGLKSSLAATGGSARQSSSPLTATGERLMPYSDPMASIEIQEKILETVQPVDEWAFDPPAMMVALGMQPDPWQVEFLRLEYRRALLNCSRRSGKTPVVAIKALHHALFSPPNKPANPKVRLPFPSNPPGP